jgi:DNA invertase Pin-like site-specific DNA recombinase
MVRQILVGIFSAMAEHERERNKQRVRAGMECARAEGKSLGRPRRSPIALSAARDDVARGVSIRQAARKRGIAQSRTFCGSNTCTSKARVGLPGTTPETHALPRARHRL